MSLPDVLKKAILNSGRTRYRIAKDAGIDPMILLRFLTDDRDIRLETADKICESLGRRLLWVTHLVEMADRSRWFAVDCAWVAIKNSIPVALQNAPPSKKPLHKMSADERLNYLVETDCLEQGDAQAIVDLRNRHSIAERDPERLTKNDAIKFVARAAILVEALWDVDT